MNDARLRLLAQVHDAVRDALDTVRDLGLSGRRDGQYALDLRADAAALDVLAAAGVGVLSEESGLAWDGVSDLVIIDPVDGSTNAARGLPWFATATCLLDAGGPAAALVTNQATGQRWWATRGGGAFGSVAHVHRSTTGGRVDVFGVGGSGVDRVGVDRVGVDRVGVGGGTDGAVGVNGVALLRSGCTEASAAIVGLNGLPPAPLGTAQSRVFGAVALDLCHVAQGSLDGYVDCTEANHGVWDYAASVLICIEAGAEVCDLYGRDLFPLDHRARRVPIAAATPTLLSQLLAARRA